MGRESESEIDSKIIEFAKHAKAKGREITDRTRAGDNSSAVGNLKVVGDNNTVAGRDVINTEKHVTVTKAEVNPGDEHISDEQASKLRELVNDVVEYENLTKKRPKTYGSVWSMLNNHCNVPKYRLIRKEDFEKAVTFLLKWKGGLSGKKSARKGDRWREDRVKAIHTIMRKYDLERKYRNYLSKKFDAESTLELTDEELEKTYRYILHLKNQAKKKGK